MKQVNLLELFKENKNNSINSGKQNYEEEMEDLCCSYLIPILKKHITDEEKTPLFIKALKTFDDKGYTNRDNLSDDDDTLNYLTYIECLSYTKYNSDMLNSNLKEETKIDIIVNDFLDSNIEDELKTGLEDE